MKVRALRWMLGLPALLTACLPAPLQTQRDAALTLSANLSQTMQVSEGKYRRPGPEELQVRVTGGAATYLYALLLPEGQAAQLLQPAAQPTRAGSSASFALPSLYGYTQLFVVGSPRPLSFPPLGESVGSLGQAVGTATAGLAPGSWNTATQVFRVGDYGKLSVSSLPGDANVYVNEAYRGRTPLVITGLDAGTLNVRLEREGYEPVRLKVQVAPDQTTAVQVGLPVQVRRGHLEVSSSVPARVQLLGNGRTLRQTAPLTADLPAGDYDLTVTPLDSALKAAWVGLHLTRDQTLSVSCQPSGARLDCQSL